jgi:glycerophosphoryl diester phosphodiesterase
MHLPQIIAHTGCEGKPDNTLESSLAGRDAGAEVLEVDVRSTKDGICVLYHDDDSFIFELTYEELLAENPMNLPAGCVLERLETVLLAFKGQTVSFNLDLKEDAATFPTIELVNRLDMWDQVYFTGATNAMAQTPYRGRIMWNTPENLREMSTDSYEIMAQNMCEMAAREGYAGINMDYPSCREYMVQCAHAQGLRVWIYTVQDIGLFQTYAEMKVDAVSTLHVSAMVTLRAQMNVLSSS